MDSRERISARLAAALGALLIAMASFAIPHFTFAEEPVGEPLNGARLVTLGDDLGFGKSYAPSLRDNFQDWGAMAVSKDNGYPVRLGDRSIRFETREGYCGRDGADWSDCANGRSRHELSTSGDPDSWNVDNWYALSLYVPEGFGTAKEIKTSIFQFWAGGLDSWMFKYEPTRGFFVQRKLDNSDTVLVTPSEVPGRWIDFVLRLRHSLGDDGSLTVWADGDPVYTYAGRTAAGDNRGRDPYFKFGLYNTAMGSDGAPIGAGGYGNGEGLPDLHLYFDEVRYASNCEGLNLANLGYDCSDFSYEGADPAQVTALQNALNELGCDVGAADGIIGRRTLAAAQECRHFGPGELPDVLTASTLSTYIALYSDPEAQTRPSDGFSLATASSELVGSNQDNALSINGIIGDAEIQAIIIGRFDANGDTAWLDILLGDNLGEPVPATVMACPRVRTESWGDGSTHAVVQFDRAGTTGYFARGGDCLVAALPQDAAVKLDYLLNNFGEVAEVLAANGYAGDIHEGLSRFLDRAAAGDIIVGAR